VLEELQQGYNLGRCNLGHSDHLAHGHPGALERGWDQVSGTYVMHHHGAPEWAQYFLQLEVGWSDLGGGEAMEPTLCKFCLPSQRRAILH
jgi:hypothetical protein